MKRLITFLIIITILTTLIVGCATQAPKRSQRENTDITEDINREPDKETEKETEKKEVKKPTKPVQITIARLLPDKAGFKWAYFGFAEYAHQMKLEDIKKEEDQIKYTIKGEVADMSGGAEGRGDYSLSITYIARPDVLIQTKQEEKMMDSEFDNLELIRGDLKKGTSWEQKVVDKERRQVVLECSITDVKEEDGKKIYSVLYKQKDSEYYEKRDIKEGIGVIAFEKLFMSEDGNFPAGYHLYDEMSGYGKE